MSDHLKTLTILAIKRPIVSSVYGPRSNCVPIFLSICHSTQRSWVLLGCARNFNAPIHYVRLTKNIHNVIVSHSCNNHLATMLHQIVANKIRVHRKWTKWTFQKCQFTPEIKFSGKKRLSMNAIHCSEHILHNTWIFSQI